MDLTHIIINNFVFSMLDCLYLQLSAQEDAYVIPQTHTHTPVAGDEVNHVLLQFEQHHAVSGVAVERVDDELVQVYAGGVGVLHARL